eukprot:530638-Pleurochrysis_carterae.AAC.1
MISLPTFWPPPRVQLHVVTLQRLTLFQLPAREEDRPDVRGHANDSNQYVKELSYNPPKVGRGLVFDPTLSVELHAIGGFNCVSFSLPPSVGTTRQLIRSATSNGRDATFTQKVHCVAAEPKETVLRLTVIDEDFGREAAYETVVLGVLREGYR